MKLGTENGIIPQLLSQHPQSCKRQLVTTTSRAKHKVTNAWFKVCSGKITCIIKT